MDAQQLVSFVHNGSEQVRFGFIAEGTANVDSHLATYDAAGTVSGIDDRSILAVLVGAIKALYAQVQDYFARTERLEERVSALEAQLAASAGGAGAPEQGRTEAPASASASGLGIEADNSTTTTAT